MSALILTALLAATPAPAPPVLSPPATPLMVDALTAYRQQVWVDWMVDLNGPYVPRRREAGSPSGVAVRPPAAADTGMGGGVEQWRELVVGYFGDRTDAALRVMSCESGGNPNAVNQSSGASGLFQFMPFWWRGEWDPFDPAENVAHAAALSAGGSDWSHWTCKP